MLVWSGCSKKSSVDTAPLQKSFASAEPATKTEADKAVEAATTKQKVATAAVAAAAEKIKQATAAAQPRDIVDIVVSEPIKIRVNAPAGK